MGRRAAACGQPMEATRAPRYEGAKRPGPGGHAVPVQRLDVCGTLGKHAACWDQSWMLLSPDGPGMLDGMLLRQMRHPRWPRHRRRLIRNLILNRHVATARSAGGYWQGIADFDTPKLRSPKLRGPAQQRDSLVFGLHAGTQCPRTPPHMVMPTNSVIGYLTQTLASLCCMSRISVRCVAVRRPLPRFPVLTLRRSQQPWRKSM